MKTDRPFISIVFCTNSARHLGEFSVGLLQLCSLMPMTNLELLVICPDSGAIRDQISGLKDAISVRQIGTVWGSRGTSRNQGFAAAAGEWVYFIDQDIRFNLKKLPAVASALMNLATYEDNIWIATGRYLSDVNCTFWGDCYNWLTNLWLLNSNLGIRMLAGNVVLRKAAFSTGPYDPCLNSGGEEIDLCERARRQGGAGIIDPDLAAIHRADHCFFRFWRRMKTHAQIKRQLAFEAGQTRPNLPLIRQVGSFPRGWAAILVWAVAQLWACVLHQFLEAPAIQKK